MGCFFRRAAPTLEVREPLEVGCPSCHAVVALSPEAIEVRCTYCGAAVHRLVETGKVQRDFAESARRQSAQQSGVPLTTASAPGTPGLPVTPQNRRARVSSGLARTADAYAALISPARYTQLVRASASELGCTPRELLNSVERIARHDGTSSGVALVKACAALLG